MNLMLLVIERWLPMVESCGWWMDGWCKNDGGRGWGICTLSKKQVIRQARPETTLAGLMGQFDALDLRTSKHELAKRASPVQKTENELSRPIRFQPLHQLTCNFFFPCTQPSDKSMKKCDAQVTLN